MGTATQMSGAEIMRQRPLLLPPDAGFEAADIPGLRKAAILMVAIGDELAKGAAREAGKQMLIPLWSAVSQWITSAGHALLIWLAGQ